MSFGILYVIVGELEPWFSVICVNGIGCYAAKQCFVMGNWNTAARSVCM